MKVVGFIFFMVVLLKSSVQYAQITYTLDSLIKRAELSSYYLRSSETDIMQKRSLQLSAVNIPNPEILAESPTGLFYTIGVLQNLDFPSVYILQSKIARQNVHQSEKLLEIQRAELRYNLATLYTEIQYYSSLTALLYKQDSLLDSIKGLMNTRKDIGDINGMEYSLVMNDYGQAHIKYLQARTDMLKIYYQIKYLTQISDTIVFSELVYPDFNEKILYDTGAYLNNLEIQYNEFQSMILKSELQLEKQKSLPGLVFGFLNQGEMYTPLRNQFRFGLTVPTWFWQNAGNISAARSRLKMQQYQNKGDELKIKSDIVSLRETILATDQIVKFYASEIITNTEQLVSYSEQLMNTGLTGRYIYLRTLKDTYDIQVVYLDNVRRLHHEINMFKFLTNQL